MFLYQMKTNILTHKRNQEMMTIANFFQKIEPASVALNLVFHLKSWGTRGDLTITILPAAFVRTLIFLPFGDN